MKSDIHFKGKTFTVVYYRNNRFYIKKEWLGINKYGNPDLSVYYYFFDPKKHKNWKDSKEELICYSGGTDNPVTVPIVAIMFTNEYEKCTQNMTYENFKKKVLELI